MPYLTDMALVLHKQKTLSTNKSPVIQGPVGGSPV
jgi:hypothetical protein